jgi:hypothetical protein
MEMICSQKELSMCVVIDFRSARDAALLRRAEQSAEDQSRAATRFEWLKQNGAPLVDQVRAALGAAGVDCPENGQTLADILEMPFGVLPN